MTAVEVSHLSYSYGRHRALVDVDLDVPEGAIYALVGPNGAGKTTLLHILAGVRRAHSGHARIFGTGLESLSIDDRRCIAYVAEGQRLPQGMRLREAEAYLAPLYPAWDAALATDLRRRFGLDPERRLGTLSRGEKMKAALLCALAPRPRLLLMDEPFTGMDVVVKDDLVRGLLGSVADQACTIIISSHDIAELEMLADRVGFLESGRMCLSESMDDLHRRFKRIVVLSDDTPSMQPVPGDRWLLPERAGRRLTFIAPDVRDDYAGTVLAARFPRAEHIDMQDASLREVFVALARTSATTAPTEAVT